MLSLKRLTMLCATLLLALLVAACGTSTSTTTGSGDNATPTPSPTTAPTATATTASSSSSAIVSTANASVKGQTKTILTDAKGMTLYYRTSDTATSVCSGACAQNWPPLLFTGSGTPTSSSQLSGTLSVMNNTNGAQVAYQGHLLYTYIGDTAAGQLTGEGLGGVWFVATTDLTTQSSGSQSGY